MKEDKKNGLYSLTDNTIVGAIVTALGPCISRTVLWHKRLGHVNEKGLSELAKQGLLGEDKI